MQNFIKTYSNAPEHATTMASMINVTKKDDPKNVVPGRAITDRSLFLSSITGTIMIMPTQCTDPALAVKVTGCEVEDLGLDDNSALDPSVLSMTKDPISGKAIVEIPKLTYHIIQYYQDLARMELKFKYTKRNIAEQFTLLPPSSDGTILTDANMEAAKALHSMGIITRVNVDDDGNENIKPREIRNAYLQYCKWKNREAGVASDQ